MNTRDEELLSDAHEVGFIIINGLIYCPPACDRMAAFRALRILIENRIIQANELLADHVQNPEA